MTSNAGFLDNLLMVSGAPFPVVSQANVYQFPPGRRLRHARVESRMVLLCRSGGGKIWVNGQQHLVRAGALFVLPWGRSIRYAADTLDPFLLIGTHVIPEHDPGQRVVAEVPHDVDHPLMGCGWRRDGEVLSGGSVVVSSAEERPQLVDVSLYAVEVFRRGVPDERLMRALGTLVLHELTELPRPAEPPYGALVPDDLRRVLQYVDQELQNQLTIGELASVAGCGIATLARRFRQHLDTSPMGWVAGRRIARAQELLRTTGLTIGQVARRCGVVDPYYFSRLFRQHVGQSPREWRRTQHVL
ncbi:helix-turn-helix domain-containing protein [Streptomyces sp. NPDC002779]|uniref:AraC family transcriptional regulator n=1 Tax=Streptomyces sp. NPDC002779 TaxID=3364664 RepID=UPI0036A97B6D